MSTTQITDHEARAEATMLSQWQDKPKIMALVRILTSRVQELDDTAWDLYTKRGVDTAEGAQLDILGEIVGQLRLGLDDDDYRRLIRVRILANRAGGKADTITRVIAGVVEVPVKYEGPIYGTSLYPYTAPQAEYRLTWSTDTTTSADLEAQVRLLLDEISPVGVAWEAVEAVATGAFRFSGGSGEGFGEGVLAHKF
jgi:hypothetical protein